MGGQVISNFIVSQVISTPAPLSGLQDLLSDMSMAQSEATQDMSQNSQPGTSFGNTSQPLLMTPQAFESPRYVCMPSYAYL